MEECAKQGAELVNIVRSAQIDQTLIVDLNEIVQEAERNGLNERVWLVGGLQDALAVPQLAYDLWLTTNRIMEKRSVERKVLALEKRFGSEELEISSVPADKPLSYICGLLPLTRRRLLYEEAFLPKGVPYFIEEPSASYSYINRPDGHFITIPCRAEGNPKPVIKWFQSGVEQVNLDSNSSSFIVSGGALLIPVGKEHIAEVMTFHCTATNLLGTIRSSSTIIRPAFIEPFRPNRLDAYPLSSRGDGTRLDCQAPPHYPKSHRYSWMRSGVTDKFVKVDERVYVSMDGTLYFSYNVKSDADTYACTLALNGPRSGQYGPFFNLVLPQTTENVTFAPKIDEYQPQVFPEVPVRGQIVQIECFAYGFPAPTYSWTRMDGKPLSKRHQITNFGRVLKILAAQPEDAVVYKCTATNERGVASAELHLVIQSPPSILRPLKDTMTSVYSEVKFSCPSAEPTPGHGSHIEWFRNGQPLVPILMAPEDRKRLKLKGNDLILKDVQEEDEGIYQCRLTNEIGSTGSIARLTVKNVSPAFHPNIFPQRVFVVEGTRLLLPCLYYAIPHGKAKWLRHDGSNAKFEEIVENNVTLLLIEKFTKAHSGRYECRATNNAGEASAFVNITLMTKPKVSISQSVQQEDEGGYGIRLTCEAELECSESDVCPEAHFDWQFNDQSARMLAKKGRLKMRQFIRSAEDPGHVKQRAELDASAAFVNHNVGRFACSSVFGGASAELEPYGGSSMATAFTPTQVKLLEVLPTAVKLAWRLPSMARKSEGIEAKLEGYQIERRTQSDRTWRPVSQALYRTQDKIIGSYLVRELSPNTKYQFRVRTQLADGTLSPASSSTDWLQTPPSPPEDIVQNIRWKILDTSHLLLEWDPVETKHTSGPNLRYNVTWTDSTNDVRHHYDIVDQPTHVIALKALTSKEKKSDEDCQIIAVGVQPLNDLGAGPAATDTVVYVTGHGPKRFAVDVVLNTYNATHLNLSWTWARAGECENVIGAQISCVEVFDGPVKEVTEQNAEFNLSIAHSYSQWLVGGLKPWTEYQCSIGAFDQYGRRGRQSLTTKPTRTAEPAPVHAPEITKIKLTETLSGYTTLIDWTAVKLRTVGNSTANERGYKVYVYISETAEKPVVLDLLESQLQDPSKPSARIDGLKLMFYYKIQVAGFNKGGTGPRSQSTTIRIGAPDQPSSARCVFCNPAAILIVLLLRILL
ncbi:unnamed protein product [Bursaphelenchus xylophilus]|nr:unnamed protein product [Bursaphelenchus xylophilus]CAG9118553.1 unnamed protein product [Bursaphelenchus xylophilus]